MFPVFMFFEKRQKSKEELQQEAEISSHFHYLDLKRRTLNELEEYNNFHNTNFTLKEAIINGIPFNNLCRKYLEEIMK